MEWKDWWQEVWRQSPAMALLIAIIATGFFQYWVWGSTYKEMKADRDEYRTLALESTGLLEKRVLPASTPPPAATPDWMPRPTTSPTPDVKPDVKAEVIAIRKKLEMLEA